MIPWELVGGVKEIARCSETVEALEGDNEDKLCQNTLYACMKLLTNKNNDEVNSFVEGKGELPGTP